MSRKISSERREDVRLRAKYLCEYCHTNEHWQWVRFTLDHIDPDGGDRRENLALACFNCNRSKSNNTTAFDAVSGEPVEIFNPRKHRWLDHFEWSNDGITLLGRTTIGRVTIDLLDLNRTRALRIREADVSVDRHPPISDR